ncbi:MAG: hypothetical protein DVB31_03920 [Verrucomicrobia bacterium]|nr:MAG: hypothetical protein DVB31_03920 [Verrucomicrobiota bacterium]
MATPTFTPSEKRVVLAMFAQHWENARHIKNERLSFTNIYCLVAAGTLSLLHSVRGETLLEFAVLTFMVAFSVIGLLTSLRLKFELEHCLRQIDAIVTATTLQAFMPAIDLTGAPLRYPKFRWLFPWFYTIAIAGFAGILLARACLR